MTKDKNGQLLQNRLLAKIVKTKEHENMKPADELDVKFTVPNGTDEVIDKDKEDIRNATPLLPTAGGPETHVVYPARWWLLVTVVSLNLANYSHWVAFPSVAKSTAKYYDQSGERMDLIPTVSYGLGIPCCLVATFIVEKYGLKTGLHIGGSLTGFGKPTIINV